MEAQAIGRAVPADHMGVIVPCLLDESRERAQETSRPYLPSNRPDVDPSLLAAVGTPEDAASRLRQYVEAGVSKFVVRFACPPEQLPGQMERFARDVLPAFHR